MKELSFNSLLQQQHTQTRINNDLRWLVLVLVLQTLLSIDYFFVVWAPQHYSFWFSGHLLRGWSVTMVIRRVPCFEYALSPDLWRSFWDRKVSNLSHRWPQDTQHPHMTIFIYNAHCPERPFNLKQGKTSWAFCMKQRTKIIWASSGEQLLHLVKIQIKFEVESATQSVHSMQCDSNPIGICAFQHEIIFRIH